MKGLSLRELSLRESSLRELSLRELSLRRKILAIILCAFIALISLYTPTPYNSTVKAEITTKSGFVFDNGKIIGYEGSSATITIPTSVEGQTVTGIAGAFTQNEFIEEVIIPQGISTITERAFWGCPNLTSISIPASVIYIEPGSLSLCENLTSLTVNSSNTLYTVVDNVMYNSDLNEIVQYICSSAPTTFEVPDTVTKIHDFAFAGSPNLTSVTIPQETTSIGDGAFANCTSLNSISVHVLNSKYKSSGGVLLTLDGKTLLSYPADKSSTSYDISSSVVTLSPYSFMGCNNLSVLYFSNSLKTITSAFESCLSLTKLMVGGANPNFSSLNGVLLSKDRKEILYYPHGITSPGYTTPSGVSKIGASSFASHPHIQNITLSDEVTTIGSYAFNGCDSLTKLLAPRSVAEFSSQALFGAKNMTVWGYHGSAIATYAEDNNIPFAAVGELTDWEYTDNGDGTCTLTKYKGTDTDVFVPSVVGNLWVKKTAVTTFGGRSDIEFLTLYNPITTIEAANSDGSMYIFEDCSNLKKIYLPKNFAEFQLNGSPDKPFKGCSALENIFVSDSNSTFYDKSGVLFSSKNRLLAYPNGRTDTSYTIPSTTSSISSTAFDNNNLKTVVIPGSVKTVSKGSQPTFANNIETVKIQEGVITVEDVFSQTKAMDIHFPKSVTTITGFSYPDLPHTFYVYENTPAHTFAQENDIEFVLLCTIEFNSNGGTSVDTTVLPAGSKITEPKNITKPDHLHKGWFTDEALTTQWDFANDTVSTGIILYAKWVEGYSITYNLNGGKNSSKNPDSYTAGTALTLSNPTRSGYNFDGWYTDESCDLKYEFKSITSDTRGNIELWADWWKVEPTSPPSGGSSSNLVTSDERKAEFSLTGFPDSVSYMREGQTITVKGKITIKYANVEDISVQYSGNNDKLYKYKEGDKRLTSYNYSHTFTLGEINYTTTDKYLITIRLSSGDFYQHSIPINKYTLITEVLNAPDNVLYLNSDNIYEIRSMAIANNTFTTLDISYVNLTAETCSIEGNIITPLTEGTAKIESNVKLSDGSVAKYVNEFSIINNLGTDPTNLERELMCQCYGEYCTGLPEEGIDPALIELIQQIRDKCGVPVHIISGYRCPEHNKIRGGDKNSQHVLGKAADIWAEGISIDELYDICDALNIMGGVGKYESYIHIDTRGVYVRWDEEQGVIDQ